MNYQYDVLQKLCRMIGPTGFEKPVQDYFAELMRPLTSRIYKDALGTCYAEMRGYHKLPKVMINAHADTIGFIVRYIGEKGFLYTVDLPATEACDYRMLPGTDVVVCCRKKNKRITGQFVSTDVPWHLMEDLKEHELAREDIAIDIGAVSETQARQHVDVGDIVTLAPNARFCDVGKRFVGTNLDDRVGIFCLYRIAKALSRSKMKRRCTVIFVSTAQEESESGAARVAAENCNADIAITVDGALATDQVTSNADYVVAKEHGLICLDKGVALARGLGVEDDVFLCLEKICRGRGLATRIPYQIEVNSIGAENWQILKASGGIKTGLVSVPMRYVHTRTEMVSLKDVENVIELVTLFCKKVSKGTFK